MDALFPESARERLCLPSAPKRAPRRAAVRGRFSAAAGLAHSGGNHRSRMLWPRWRSYQRPMRSFTNVTGHFNRKTLWGRDGGGLRGRKICGK